MATNPMSSANAAGSVPFDMLTIPELDDGSVRDISSELAEIERVIQDYQQKVNPELQKIQTAVQRTGVFNASLMTPPRSKL
jgi:hypothetical protein